MTTWRITLFGQLRLWRGEQELKAFQHRKAGVLLSYLACHQQTWHNRNQLAAQLWPDSDTDAAKLSLRVALSRIRERLGGAEAIESQGERLRLSPEQVQIDVTEFERAIRHGEWHIALDIYTAPLLPHYDESWASTKRQQLADHFQTALLKLTDAAEAAQDWEKAIEYVRWAVKEDPYRESTHQRLMKLYLATGRPAAAQAQFRELDTLFREEFRTLPSEETRALLQPTSNPITLTRAAALVAPPQTVAPPPLRSTLPTEWTVFVGRQQELQDLHTLFDKGKRLITLVGTGGVGKTRLTSEFARSLEKKKSTECIFWASLAEISTLDEIWETILTAIHRSGGSTKQPLKNRDAVLEFLSSKSVLLVLDNLEHININDSRHIILDLLKSSEYLSILTTSRTQLNLRAEQVYQLQPLVTPSRDNMSLPCTSTELFFQLAQQRNPKLELSKEITEDVGRLCHALDGLPLAIEIAASCTHRLSPKQILHEVLEHADVLKNENFDTPDRHLSLRSTLDWSLKSLPRNIVSFFEVLSYFKGGWTIEAAIAVSGLTEEETNTALSTLHNSSLITYDSEKSRYGMLESIRSLIMPTSNNISDHAIVNKYCNYFYSIINQDNKDPKKWISDISIDIENISNSLNIGIKNPLLFSEAIVTLGKSIYYWTKTEYTHIGTKLITDAESECVRLQLNSFSQLQFNTYLCSFYYNKSNKSEWMSQINKIDYIARILQDRESIVLAISEKIRYYTTINDLDESIKLLSDLIECQGNKDFGTPYFMSLLNIGTSYLDLGNDFEAEKYFRKCFNSSKEVNISKNLIWHGAAALEIGKLKLNQGHYTDAEKWLSIAEPHLSFSIRAKAKFQIAKLELIFLQGYVFTELVQNIYHSALLAFTVNDYTTIYNNISLLIKLNHKENINDDPLFLLGFLFSLFSDSLETLHDYIKMNLLDIPYIADESYLQSEHFASGKLQNIDSMTILIKGRIDSH